MPKRCALGCPPLGVPTHVFPHPEKYPEIFKTWVEIAGGKLVTSADYELYMKKKICDIHFTDSDKNRNHRLNALAVPTLHLPCRTMKVDSACIDVTQRQPLTSKENLTDCPVNDPKATSEFVTFLETGNSKDSFMSLSTPSLDVIQPSASKENVLPPCLNVPTSKSKGNLKDNLASVSTPSADKIQPSALKACSNVSTSTSEANLKDLVTTAGLGTALNEASTSKEITPDTSSVLKEHNYSKQKYSQRKVVPTLQASKIRRTAVKIINKTEVKNLKTKINKLTKKNKIFKQRLENADKLSNDAAFRRVTRNMSTSAKLFTKMQMTETNKKPSGRRFTLEQKILSLSLFKRGARVYKLLSKLFTLPSAKTLRSLLSEIKLGSGLIDIIFEKMKDTVQNMNFDDKLCTLVFDEMALTPQLNYDRANDKLKGFSDFEDKKIADHVLVFMIKGVKANYKQPVAYYFTNSVNKFALKKLIKEVIKKLQATGLTVLCTVCDQGSANVGAINELVQDCKNDFLRQGKAWRHDFFEVNKKQIIPLFDVPHLLKGMRNNLLNKDLIYTDFNDNNKEKIVKWSYFQKVYEADKCEGELSMLYKLTEEHLNPEKIKKMRVKNAAQIFSHSIAVATSHLVARKLVDEECRQLVPFVILMDNLFDTLNASTLHIPDGKMYRGCIRRFSPHHQLWQNAIKTFKTMKFLIKKKTRANKIQLVESVTPTLKKFIKTIEGMQVLWLVLSKNYQFDCMLTRHFNQDPLENFFGSVRSYGVRNIAPNCTSFEGAYKSLLLNNYSATHSLQANCENDTYECLQNLNFFLKEKLLENPCNQRDCEDSQEEIVFNEEVLAPNVVNDLGQSNYVCGWVLTKCLKNVVKGCKTCKGDLLCKEERTSNEFIKAKEYTKDKKWLVYPSKQCEEAFKDIQNITVCVLKKDVPKTQPKKKIKLMVDTLVHFPSTCSTHYEKLRVVFVNTCIDVLIYSWCRSINRILAGKITYEGEDEMKTIAQNYHNKHRTRK